MREQLGIQENYSWDTAQSPTGSISTSAPAAEGSLWRAFLRDPSVASILPSSQSLCRNVVANIKDIRKPVIELGAGNGVLTKHILNTLHWSAPVYAFETNKTLLGALKENCREQRLTTLHQSAEELETVCVEKAIEPGTIISGIPFRFIQSSAIHSIIEQCRNVLDNQGRFIMYQTWVPRKGMHSPLQNALEEHFTFDSRTLVLWNIPPLYVQVCMPKRRM